MQNTSTPRYPENKPSDWITYAAQMLQQAERDGQFQFSAYATRPSNDSTSHGQVSDAALDGSAVATRKH